MAEQPLRDSAAPLGIPEFDLADRMRKALRESRTGVQAMADYLEVERGTVSTWINGRIKPSSQTVRLFALRTGVNYSWLKDGIADDTSPDEPEKARTGYRTRRAHRWPIVPSSSVLYLLTG